MGMRCSILGVTPVQIQELVATPALVDHLVLAAWDELKRAKADHAADDRVLTKKLQVLVAEARQRIAQLGSFEPPLDLEKWWHILHYLLTGRVGPAGGDGDFLLTGQALGTDMGYGPARLHSPAETGDFSRFLEMQDLANLQARIYLGEMSRLGIYPGVIGPETRNGAVHYFVRLQDYVRKMSDRGNGLLIWII
jgi:hypothetical protein